MRGDRERLTHGLTATPAFPFHIICPSVSAIVMASASTERGAKRPPPHSVLNSPGALVERFAARDEERAERVAARAGRASKEVLLRRCGFLVEPTPVPGAALGPLEVDLKAAHSAPTMSAGPPGGAAPAAAAPRGGARPRASALPPRLVSFSVATERSPPAKIRKRMSDARADEAAYAAREGVYHAAALAKLSAAAFKEAVTSLAGARITSAVRATEVAVRATRASAQAAAAVLR